MNWDMETVDRVVRVNLSDEQRATLALEPEVFYRDLAQRVARMRETIVPVSVILSYQDRWLDSLPCLLATAMDALTAEQLLELPDTDSYQEVLAACWRMR